MQKKIIKEGRHNSVGGAISSGRANRPPVSAFMASHMPTFLSYRTADETIAHAALALACSGVFLHL